MAAAHPHFDRDYDGDQSHVGRHLLYESGNDPWRLMLWARLPVIALTLLFGLVVFAFGRELAGAVGGLGALTLYAFSPDVVAHGSLATLDVPSAGFVLTSVWLLWRARSRPRLYLPLAGAALGAAVATKMNTLAAVPVLLLLAGLSVWRARRTKAPGSRLKLLARTVAGAALVALVAVAVVWASYLVVDPRLRWSPTPGEVPAVHGPRGRLVGLLPFPEVYRDGMRMQFGLENAHWEGFLFGRHYEGSLWYYLPAALLVKTPLGMLALWAAGTAALLTTRQLRPFGTLLAAAGGGAAGRGHGRGAGLRGAVRHLRADVRRGGGGRCARAAAAVGAGRGGGAAGVRDGQFAADVPVLSAVRQRGVRLGRRRRTSGCTTPTSTGARTWGGSRTGCGTGTRAQRVWLVYKGSGVPSYYGIHASDPRGRPERKVRGLLVVSDSSVAKARGRLARLIHEQPRGRRGRPLDHDLPQVNGELC